MRARDNAWTRGARDDAFTSDRPAPQPDYQVALGTITHLLIGYLATDCRGLADPARNAALRSAAGQLATVERFGRRRRAARMSSTGAAAVYDRYFLPPPEWNLVGVELDIEGGRIDLAWELPGSTIIFDELKLAFGRSRPRGIGPTDRQCVDTSRTVLPRMVSASAGCGSCCSVRHAIRC